MLYMWQNINFLFKNSAFTNINDMFGHTETGSTKKIIIEERRKKGCGAGDISTWFWVRIPLYLLSHN